MAEHDRRLRDSGAKVVVISFAGPPQVAHYQAQHPLPFDVFADPQRAAYRAFGLGSAGWGRMLGLRVIARYLALMLRGWMPKKPAAGDDPHQLGGDFVFDARGRLVYAFRSYDPTDRPPTAELLAAVEQAAATT